MCVTTPLSATKILKDTSRASVTRTIATTQGLTHVNHLTTLNTATTTTTPSNGVDHSRPQHTSIMMVRMIGDEFLTEERDRKYYADHYTCCPPPLFIILITLVEHKTH
ncbi:hypothetical protein PV325_009678 [Microctonus aethiopoides]|nr:hypothetical protein PV325_009678 [Microctonus aethiopoides]